MVGIDPVVAVWSCIVAAGGTLAVVHLMAWLSERRPASLAFVVLTAAVAAMAAFELGMMRATSPQQFGDLLRWAHVSVFALVVGTVAFVCFTFPAQRGWLGLAAVAARGAALIPNFFAGNANLNFVAITELRTVELLGQPVALPVGIPSAWTKLGEVATLLLLAYVIDATFRQARARPEARRQTYLLGGALAAFIVIASSLVALMHRGIVPVPYMLSVPYLGVAAVMAWELSRSLVRATRLAEDLRESERRNELAARAAGVGLWTWDVPDGHFWASAVARELHMIATGESARGFDALLDRVHGEDRERIRARLDRLALGGAELVIGYRVATTPGNWRWVESRGLVERDSLGRPLLVRGVSMDVTDRHEAEERFRLVVEAAPNALLVVDEDDLVTLANPQAESLFRAEPGRLLGVPIGLLAPGLGPHLAAIHGRGAWTEDRRSDKRHELRGMRLDGSEFLVDVGLRALETRRGRQTLASIVDISAQHEHERELHRLREQSANAARMNLAGQLASTLAHELNQPLGAILRNAETAGILLERPDPDLAEIESILDDIRSDDRRAGAIIDHMRSLLRRREPELAAVSVGELLLRVAALIRHDANARHVNVELQLTDALVPAYADAVHVQQVLLNLAYNALHALEQVPARARRLGLHARNTPGGVELAVSDTGPGLPADAMARLFDPFFTTKPDGMGMGLSICRSLVEGMGGRIDAGNAIGGGAVFRISLRAAPVPA